MGNTGWISIHRQLQDCWIWQISEPFDKRSAWIDLLLLANHKEVKIPFNNKIEIIKRGSFITSMRGLSERWKWSIKKVGNFLDLLQSDFMIEQKRDSKKTLITIVNYGKYQDVISEKETVKQHKSNSEENQEKSKGETKEKEKKTNNNDNKGNNDNKRNNDNIYNASGKSKKTISPKNIIPPTVEMIQKYCDERGNNINAESFFNYYESKGWLVGKNKMKDWQASVRVWEGNNKKKIQTQAQTQTEVNFDTMDWG